MIVAVDGPAASGKGTLAKQIAKKLTLAHLDTGALYRAVGLQILNAGKDLTKMEEKQCVDFCLNLDLSLTKSPQIRNDKIAKLASLLAAMPAVRTALLDLQRNFAVKPPYGNGVVLDGRDIGTVVLPNADVKFFVDADVQVRAKRRTKELLSAGQSVTLELVLEDLKARDRRDRTRSTSPLKAAKDSVFIDTSKMSVGEVLKKALLHLNNISDKTFSVE